MAQYQLKLAGQSIRALPAATMYRIYLLAMSQISVFPARTESEQRELAETITYLLISEYIQKPRAEQQSFSWEGVTPDLAFTPKFVVAVDYWFLPEPDNVPWDWEVAVPIWPTKRGRSAATLPGEPEITFVVLNPIPTVRQPFKNWLKMIGLSFSPMLAYTAATIAAPIVLPIAKRELEKREKTRRFAGLVPEKI